MPRAAVSTISHQEAVRAALDILGPLGEADFPLGPLTTYRVGGCADVASRVSSLADLETVAAARSSSGLPVLVVGRGSNLLISDRGFRGIAVLLVGEEFSYLGVDGLEVHAGAAVPLPVLARRSAEASLTGLEWAVGVPGSVGGAVRMNAGGHGSDTASSLLRAQVADLGALAPSGQALEVSGRNAGASGRNADASGRNADAPSCSAGASPPGRSMSASELCYGYRRSCLGPSEVVIGAVFGLQPGDARASQEQIRSIVRWRRLHQPGGQNAGSVFVNPPTCSAGWLVESAGLKGTRIGSATVSDKHANFIQADPGGSAEDVRALMDHIRSEVQRRYGVLLESEVRLVGFSSPKSLTLE